MKYKQFEPREVEAIRFTIRPQYVVKTLVRTGENRYKSKLQIKNESNLRNHSTRGQLSEKSKKKLMQSIDWLILAAINKDVYSLKTNSSFKFKINFITLTIAPQENEEVNEKVIKKLVNTWLSYHRKYSALNNYVWKVEFHKDGRMHIHIASDSFIHYQTIRDSWNRILKRNGLLNLHFKKFNNFNPNSTDVHSVKKVRKLAAYLSKYMSKQNLENDFYTGRVWSCSSKISKALKTSTTICVSMVEKIFNVLHNTNIKYLSIHSKPNSMGKTFQVAELYFLKIKDWLSLKGTALYEIFKDTIEFLRPNEWQLSQSQKQLNFI